MTSLLESLLSAGPTFDSHTNITNNTQSPPLPPIKRSSDTDPQFPILYASCAHLLRRLQFAPSNHLVVIQSGEGMLALWSALKSILLVTNDTTHDTNSNIRINDNNNEDDLMRVLCISNGVYGRGIWEMCRAIRPMTTADCQLLEFDWRKSQIDIQLITARIKQWRPTVVTVVHCDTPCGSLIASKDMQAIGEAVQAVGGLFLVDFVSSCGGWVVDVGRWRVDVGCFAMQKCLGLAPTLCSVTLSPRAVQWVSGSPNAAAKPYTSGYDVLAPWLGVVKRLIQFNSSHNDCIICSTSHTVAAAAVAAATVDCDESFDYSFPYTLDYDSFHQLWHRLAGLLNQGQLIDAAAINETTVPGDDLMEYFNREPGLVANHWLRHLQAQRYAIDRLSSVRGGLELFITQPAMRSPTCTALLLPPNWLWSEWKRALAARGVYVSGGGGAGDRVFRLGHMGPQASIDNLKRAIDIMEQILLLQQH